MKDINAILHCFLESDPLKICGKDKNFQVGKICNNLRHFVEFQRKLKTSTILKKR